MSGPLSGVRVLDLSRVLAGPWCVQNLGDLGADVIKIERPGPGDDSRQWGPPWLADAEGKPTRESAYYLSANRNKRSVAIDMAKPEGQQLIRRLAERADLCIENFKVGDLARYGLDAVSLCQLNPRLVYCSITGFGQDGPYAERPGYDYLFQGLGGLMSVTGERDDLPGGGPQRTGVPIVDLFTGMYATVSILAALHHRDATGEGQRIDVSLLDVVLALSSGQLSNFLISGKVPQRLGNVSPNITPYEVFACADGQMIVASANQTQFVTLCRALGRPEWATDARFCNNEARLAHRDELHALLEDVFRARSGTEWEDLLYKAGVPCGPINDYAQALAHPQAQFHGTRIDIAHALGVRAPGIASPMRFSATPVEYRHAPPLLGQHTREVLIEQLALTSEELERLEAGRVIACAKPGSAA
jgi:crotonobetainyl-CoA:carnitine CoA-transferase CaiB-like acyl-CoA transferase